MADDGYDFDPLVEESVAGGAAPKVPVKPIVEAPFKWLGKNVIKPIGDFYGLGDTPGVHTSTSLSGGMFDWRGKRETPTPPMPAREDRSGEIGDLLPDQEPGQDRGEVTDVEPGLGVQPRQEGGPMMQPPQGFAPPAPPPAQGEDAQFQGVEGGQDLGEVTDVNKPEGERPWFAKQDEQTAARNQRGGLTTGGQRPWYQKMDEQDAMRTKIAQWRQRQGMPMEQNGGMPEEKVPGMLTNAEITRLRGQALKLAGPQPTPPGPGQMTRQNLAKYQQAMGQWNRNVNHIHHDLGGALLRRQQNDANEEGKDRRQLAGQVHIEGMKHENNIALEKIKQQGIAAAAAKQQTGIEAAADRQKAGIDAGENKHIAETLRKHKDSLTNERNRILADRDKVTKEQAIWDKQDEAHKANEAKPAPAGERPGAPPEMPPHLEDEYRMGRKARERAQEDLQHLYPQHPVWDRWKKNPIESPDEQAARKGTVEDGPQKPAPSVEEAKRIAAAGTSTAETDQARKRKLEERKRALTPGFGFGGAPI